MLAADPLVGAGALHLLGATPELVKRLQEVPVTGVATAIRCELPLIKTTSYMEELIGLDSRHWRIGAAGEATRAIRDLTLYFLRCAHDAAIQNPTSARVLFGLSSIEAAEKLAELGVWHQDLLSQSVRPLIRIREQSDLGWWGRLLIGERCEGPKALRFARYAAQQRIDVTRARTA
jgi:hypothetical protein